MKTVKSQRSEATREAFRQGCLEGVKDGIDLIKPNADNPYMDDHTPKGLFQAWQDGWWSGYEITRGVVRKRGL